MHLGDTIFLTPGEAKNLLPLELELPPTLLSTKLWLLFIGELKYFSELISMLSFFLT